MLVDRGRVRTIMQREGLDSLVASSRENVYYMSGFRSYDPGAFSALLFPMNGDDLLLLPKSDEYCITEECWTGQRKFFGNFYVEGVLHTKGDFKGDFENPVEGICSTLREFGAKDIGIEEKTMPYEFYEQLVHEMPTCNFKKASKIFEELRTVKSDEEVRRIKRAVKVWEKVLLSTYGKVKEGITELEIAKELEIAIAAEGADWIWVEMGGAAGAPTGPTKHEIAKGEILHLDFGVRDSQGYCSDMSRQAVLGEPNDKQRKVNQALISGLKKAIDATKPGVKVSQVFRIGQETVRQGGFPRYLRHRIGHSIGLLPSESPSISPNDDKVVEAGMVLCIELPYYIHGFGTFNVEDMVLVTEGGCDRLSTLDRELTVL